MERVVVVEQAHVAVDFRFDAAALAQARYEFVRDAAQPSPTHKATTTAEHDVGDVEPGGIRIAPIQEGHDLPPRGEVHVGGLYGCH